MQFQPLGNIVLIKENKRDEKTKSGILLPENIVEQQSETYTVISVGPGKRDKDGVLIPMQVNPGDVVVIGKYAGHEVEIDAVKYKALPEEDIILRVI
jgi:chaperonin GroES